MQKGILIFMALFGVAIIAISIHYASKEHKPWPTAADVEQATSEAVKSQ